jgi:hypothetical protein
VLRFFFVTNGRVVSGAVPPPLLNIFSQEANDDFIKCAVLGQREFGFFILLPWFMSLCNNTYGFLMSMVQQRLSRGRQMVGDWTWKPKSNRFFQDLFYKNAIFGNKNL